MKYLFIISMLLLFAIGCSDTYPVPEQAVNDCLNKGWCVSYYSNVQNGTVFECKPCISKGE